MGVLKGDLDPSVFYDYFFLISRGYTPLQAILLVKQRRRIDRKTEILLKRCVHSIGLVDLISLRLVDPKAVREKCLCVDGFNQFSTIAAIIGGKPIYRCNDMIIRDNELGSIDLKNYLQKVLSLVADALTALKPSKVIFVFDYSKPKSKEIMLEVQKTLSTLQSIELEYLLARKADRKLQEISRNCIIASSDILVILSASQIFDLAGYIANKRRVRVTDISSLLVGEHTKWCSGPVA